MARRARIIETPSGRFVFVGKVPIQLHLERLDGEPVTKQDVEDAAHVGLGFLKKRLRERSWETREAALAEAYRLGVLSMVCDC